MTKPSEPERWRYASPESPNTTSLSSQSHTSEVTQGKTNEGQPEKIGVPGFVSISPKNSLGTDTGSVDPSTSRVTLATYYLMGLYASYSHYKDLIFNYLDRSRSFVIPRPLLFELFSTLYDDMKVEVDLHSRLTQNTRRPLPPISASTTVEEFCGWFRGANIRWELLGVVFALAGLASVHTAEPEKPLSYESFATDMYTASRVCIEICEEDNQMNDMTTWMRHTNVALASNLFGDTSRCLLDPYSIVDLLQSGNRQCPISLLQLINCGAVRFEISSPDIITVWSAFLHVGNPQEALCCCSLSRYEPCNAP